MSKIPCLSIIIVKNLSFHRIESCFMSALTIKSYRKDGKEMYDITDLTIAHVKPALVSCGKLYIDGVWLVRFMRTRRLFLSQIS